MAGSLLGDLSRRFLNKAPVPYAPRRSGFQSLFGRGSSQTAGLEAYGAVGMLFAVVNRLSDTTSSLKWRLYRMSDGRGRLAGGEDRREVAEHQLLSLWDNPNPFYTGKMFRETIQQHIELAGEATIVIGRSPLSSLPLELWPVRPDRMVPVKHPTEFLTGWIYNGPEGEKVPLGLDEVWQIKMPNPLDPYRGMGPVQAMMVDIESEQYSAEWNRNFFLNGAEPGGIIEVDHELDDDEFDQMRDRWREQHQGVSNAHRVAILEQGKWVERKFSMRDLQFHLLRRLSRDVIRETYGFPKTMLGTTEDVNRSNAEAGEITFARWMINNRGDRIKDALNGRLLPLFPQWADVQFDFDSPVPLDREADDATRNSKAKAAKDLTDAGYDPSDVLTTVGLPPMKTAPKPEPVALGGAPSTNGKPAPKEPAQV